MFGKSKFQKALENWIQFGGDLSDRLNPFNNYPIKRKKDAIAITNALKNISLNKPVPQKHFSTPLFNLASFFQNVESKNAFSILVDKGLPELRRILNEGLEYPNNNESDLLFILKILAFYQQEQDAILIAEVAQSSFQPEEYMWSVILSIFDAEHPHHNIVIDKLRTPLPKGFIGISYLDLVNGHAINNNLRNHPFNSSQGIQCLSKWLSGTNEDHFSYAHSATVALPFIDEQKRKPLIQYALNHPDKNIQIESAWVLAKIGDPSGIDSLKKWALNVNYSSTACEYLNELGLKHEIPATALEDNFQAMAEMANWLSHPNEFGRPPNNIELYDTRVIYWPPTDDTRQVWLFKYTYEPLEQEADPDISISMVGSITFALFGEATAELTPLEVYGLHCAWELEGNEDKRAPAERTAQSGISILKEYNKDLQ